MISWSNADFRHRVEQGSMPRRLLGPMVLDVASASLLGVGGYTTCYTGYECVAPATEKQDTAKASADACYSFCSSIPSPQPDQFTWDSTTKMCKCFDTCTEFRVAASVGYYKSGGQCPDLNVLPDDPIAISAASYKGRSSVRGGKFYTLQVTFTLPAADTLDRRELLMKTSTNKHALNSTTYAFLVEGPGADDVTYKRTSVHPRLKPASLKKPAVQAGGELLWSDVAMPLYASKNSTRTFKVTFKVHSGATSPLTFVASAWKGDTKLQTATPVVVTVTSK